MTNTSIVAGLFVLLLVLLINPFSLWMPTGFQYMLVGGLAIVAAVFVGLFVGDTARDEREEALRAKSARVGYLVGVGILTVGIAVSILMYGHADQWLIYALGAMVLVRLFTRLKEE